MSFDTLQAAIRRARCPLALELDGALPESLRPSEGAGAEQLCSALEEYGVSMIDTLSPILPALILSLPPYQALGWRGIALLERLAAHGRERGMFVIAHVLQGAAGPAAMQSAGYWLSVADCLTVNGYLGSAAIRPALEQARQTDGCLFVLLRDVNGGEVPDLVTGGRQVHQAVADLALRLDRAESSSRIGALFGSPYPSDLRGARKRMEKTFFLLPSLPVEDTLPAFDKFGRGALVTLDNARPVLPEQARQAALSLREEYRGYFPFL